MDKQLEDKIMESLEEVIDPELGVDIVNLGLVYGVEMEENNTVIVTMTLTYRLPASWCDWRTSEKTINFA